ncbi:hypothetical protein GEM21_05415 [Salmonella enterica]|nr:hypothetical protein [Salmonella enterica]EEO2148451.1 hypothetical protein [Salmonella enterica]EIL8912087.1 HNH endonuclease [Salmonella enterica]
MNLERLYKSLIAICAERNGKPLRRNHRKEGYEIHHIIARSLGGSDKPSNLVYLTPREHFTAHHILARLYGGGLSYAFLRMSQPKQGKTGRDYRISSRQYATAQELAREIAREQMTGRKQSLEQVEKRVTKIRGRTHSPETKDLMSESMIGNQNAKGLKRSADHLAIISQTHKGKVVSEETREKQRQAGLRRKFTPEQMEKIREIFSHRPVLTCPHCGLESSGPRMKTNHFDNCPVLHGGYANHQIVTCPHCSKHGIYKNIRRSHFDNCKHRPS